MTENLAESEIIETVQNEATDEKKWCVYIHTNKTNDKKYIGITGQNPPERRWRNGTAYKNNPYFINAIEKYGWDGFKHEVILTGVTLVYAQQVEIALIKHYKTRNPLYGYNLTNGGEGVEAMTDEIRKKISVAHIGMLASEATKKKMSEQRLGENNSFYGKHHSEESKKKISEANKVRSGEDTAFYGKHHSEETKAQLSMLQTKRLSVPENNPFYGKHHSDESKEKIRNTRILKYGKPVYCCEFNKIFWGAKEVQNEFGFFATAIADCCRQKLTYAYKHPDTGEKLHWFYVYNQEQKDGTIIPGAITLGYISQKDVDNCINNLIKKGD